MVAGTVLVVMFQFQVEKEASQVQMPLKAIHQLMMLTKKALINTSWIWTEYDIDRPESEMACHYLNSRAPGGQAS